MPVTRLDGKRVGDQVDGVAVTAADVEHVDAGAEPVGETGRRAGA